MGREHTMSEHTTCIIVRITDQAGNVSVTGMTGEWPTTLGEVAEALSPTWDHADRSIEAVLDAAFACTEGGWR